MSNNNPVVISCCGGGVYQRQLVRVHKITNFTFKYIITSLIYHHLVLVTSTHCFCLNYQPNSKAETFPQKWVSAAFVLSLGSSELKAYFDMDKQTARDTECLQASVHLSLP